MQGAAVVELSEEARTTTASVDSMATAIAQTSQAELLGVPVSITIILRPSNASRKPTVSSEWMLIGLR
jgi:hypothetical protein